MEWLWTAGGTSFGFREAEELWTYDGRHVGHFEDERVYAANGSYLGELIENDRLVAALAKPKKKIPPFQPKAEHPSSRRIIGTSKISLPEGYEDFPRPDRLP